MVYSRQASVNIPDSIPDFILEDRSNQAELAGYPSVDEYDWAMSELEKASTISIQPVASSNIREVTIHSLTQEVVRGQLLADEGRFVEVFKAIVRLLMTNWSPETLMATTDREQARTAR